MFCQKWNRKISLLCVMFLLFSSSNITAFAGTDEMSEKQVVKEAVHLAADIDEIDENMIDDTVAYIYSAMDTVEDVKLDNSDNVQIDVEMGDSEGEISIIEANEGGTVLEIREGDKQNTISISNEGEIFVNGEFACISYEDDTTISLDAQSSYNTLNVHTVKVQIIQR